MYDGACTHVNSFFIEDFCFLTCFLCILFMGSCTTGGVVESGTSVCMGTKNGLLHQKWILTSTGCIKSQVKGGMSLEFCTFQCVCNRKRSNAQT